MGIYKGSTKIASANVTGDTLPINTIVDYAGTTVPDGWQLATDDGWDTVPTTMVYASATTITVPSGAAAIYSKGDKLRLKQGGAYKYFYIITVADTLLTVTGGSDYTVANDTITDMYYSHQETPIGFPSQFNFTSTFTRGGTAFTNPPTNNGSKFKIIGNYVIGQVDFTMVASAGGTGEIYSSTPTPVVGSVIGIGMEVAATATAFTTTPLNTGKLNYYTIVSPAVIAVTEGYHYVGGFSYYI